MLFIRWLSVRSCCWCGQNNLVVTVQKLHRSWGPVSAHCCRYLVYTSVFMFQFVVAMLKRLHSWLIWMMQWCMHVVHFMLLVFMFFQCLTLLVGWQERHPACKKSWTSKSQRFFFVRALETLINLELCYLQKNRPVKKLKVPCGSKTRTPKKFHKASLYLHIC